MKIQITSFINDLTDKSRLYLTKDVINKSLADVLMFCGNTIGFVNDLERLGELIVNRDIDVIFELGNINSSKINNCLYHINNGKINNLYSSQIFSVSSEINGNFQLADRFIHELETKRRITIKGLNFLIIQCGEINILKNIQNNSNKVEFRLIDHKNLLDRFTNVLNETNIILNPIHTPMGNQGKMHKRREFLSTNNKYYFSASNTKNELSDLNIKSLQYAYFNGNEIDKPNAFFINGNSISRMYNLKSATFKFGGLGRKISCPIRADSALFFS